MHNFFKMNYLYSEPRPVGIYHVHRKRKGGTDNFFYVRVINEKGILTTIAKCETKEDARKVYRKYMGKGKIYYEEITTA